MFIKEILLDEIYDSASLKFSALKGFKPSLAILYETVLLISGSSSTTSMWWDIGYILTL